MSVCQYYLRGNCRFGNRCNFVHENSHPQPRGPRQQNPQFRPRHPINSNYNYVARPQTNQNRGGSYPRTNKYADVFKWVKENFADEEKALDILGELQREARVWQKSQHLWRFTSKSLFPGGQPLEGWSDQSFEEISWAYRTLKSQDQDHVYKKAYYEYYENIVRQLNELAQLKLDRLIAIKDYIRQYVDSNHKPSKTLPTDVEMSDLSGNAIVQPIPVNDPANYTPEDQLLEDERTAFQSDTFEFGNVPIHAPPREFC